MGNWKFIAWLLLLPLLCASLHIQAQSLEIMPGNNFVFTDIQFFKPLDKQYRTTLFSRTRARLTYDDAANGIDFFSGAYLNYTTKLGFGATVIGRINNSGSDLDIGVHFYKVTKDFSIFALPSISLSADNTYSWFSIVKYYPKLNEKWKLYTSLELFTVLNKSDHALSTQRLRLGVERSSYQFGLGVNISEVSEDWIIINDNYGIFLRKEF